LSQQAIFHSAYDVNDNMVIATIDTMQTRLDNLKQRSDVVDAAYALEYADEILQTPINHIFIKFKK
jgi:hypothetical protein